MSFPHVTHLSLSGGGLCGLSYIGCIRFLQTESLTHNLRHVSGTSIGAYFACAIALDIPYRDLEQIIKDHTKDESVNFETHNLMNIFTTMGVNDGDFLVLSLRKYVRTNYNGSDDITFLDLCKATGKHLVVCASCVEKACAQYFSVDNTPHVGVIEAVKASMSIPVLIKPVKIGEYHYVDGAIADNHPVTCFGDPPPLSMLSIKVSSKVEVPANVMSSFPEYIITLFRTYFSLVDKQFQKTKWSLVMNESPIQFLPIKYTSTSIKLQLTDSEIDNAIGYGYTKLQEWFLSKQNKHPFVL